MNYHKNLPIPEKIQQRAVTSYTVVENGCWVSNYKSNVKGYVMLGSTKGSYDKRKTTTFLAHRASWVFHNGRQIPDGFVIDHKCFNHSCINPEHLRLLTRTQNNARKEKFGGEDWPLDECRWGHKLTEMRTVGKADPRQRCGPCMKERNETNAVIFSALGRLELTYGIRLTAQQQGMVDEFMPAVQLPIHSSTDRSER